MPDADFVQRIEILEQEVEGLEVLPARMTVLESQILQLGDNMRAEFSAIRQEMVASVGALRTELRAEMYTLHQDVIAKISQLEKKLSERISSGDEETRRYMRVLHEDVIERISRIQEGPPPRRRKR